MRKILVIYHREDNDGVCSAAIIENFIRKYEDRYLEQTEIKYFGASYGELNNIWKEHEYNIGDTTIRNWILSYDSVYMVDISFNDPEAMELMYHEWDDNFVWCDHHKPAIDESHNHDYGRAPGVRSTEASAIMNTWTYMSRLYGSDKKPSEWIEMLSDYDSWSWTRKEKYNTPNNKHDLFAFNTGTTNESDLKIKWFLRWTEDWILRSGSEHNRIAQICLELGRTITELDKKRHIEALNNYGDLNWEVEEGRPAIGILSTEHMNSQSFSDFLNYHKSQGRDLNAFSNGIVIKFDRMSGDWMISLYNTHNEDDFDCGKYLKEKYGGGGHKGAAGCTVTTAQLGSLLITRKL